MAEAIEMVGSFVIFSPLRRLVSKVLLNVTLSAAKGLGVAGSMRTMPSLTPRFFVASLLRMTQV